MGKQVGVVDNSAPGVVDLEFSFAVVYDLLVADGGSVYGVLAKLKDRGELTEIRPQDPFNYTVPVIGDGLYCVQQNSGGWQFIGIASNNSLVASNTKNPNTNVRTQDGETVTGYNYVNNNIPAVERYEGDTVIESRFGSRIRLGSTQDGNTNIWSDDDTTRGSGVIAISNGLESFEDTSTDLSYIYLTTDQSLPLETITSDNIEQPNTYRGAQVVVGGDRIVLDAKNDNAIISAPNGTVGVKTEGWNADMQTTLNVVNTLLQQVEELSAKVAELSLALTTATAVGPSPFPLDPNTINTAAQLTTEVTTLQGEIKAQKDTFQKMKG